MFELLNKFTTRVRAARLRREFKTLSIEQRFERIYGVGHWSSNQETASGSGSTLENTRLIREALPAFMGDMGFKSIFDAPCGDLHWMQHVRFDEDTQYIGGDIVKLVVERNLEHHSAPNRRFIQFDVTRDPFPETDLWFCRDCLLHFSYDDIWRTLENFAKSSIPYMLVTNMAQIENNRDIVTGQSRRLNLCIAPFNLPEPVASILDANPSRTPKTMSLWRRKEVCEITNGRL